MLERLTLIKGGSESYQIYRFKGVNFTFTYLDKDLGTKITDLKTHSYTWEKSGGGASGQGNLIRTTDNKFILDIDTENMPLGKYSIVITLDKDNYETKIEKFSLSIVMGDFEYVLGNNFDKKRNVHVVKGSTLIIKVELNDAKRGDNPITGATVILKIGNDEFKFDEVEPGVYEYKFDTEKYNTFYTSKIITGTIVISKNGFNTEKIDIIIHIDMEEISPGIRKFYVLLFILLLVFVLGSLIAIEYYEKNITKKIKAIKKKEN